ncbi:gag protease polyprotein [Cucumis melo var. makuwa]|uniref:Gag protease polyprotein n=1 Tax=Cucumis melo var. makuwa TaxID=1194695 RepID=A0A5A7VMM5_CUCMM|nr:gag protease polyprotein [Cucumis melo var. makuwa]
MVASLQPPPLRRSRRARSIATGSGSPAARRPLKPEPSSSDLLRLEAVADRLLSITARRSPPQDKLSTAQVTVKPQPLQSSFIPELGNPSRVRCQQPSHLHSRVKLTRPARPRLLCSRATLHVTSMLGKCDFAVRTRLSKSPRCMLAYRIKVVPTWVSFGITTFLGQRSPTGPPIVLGVPLGSPKTSYVPLGSHVERVRERASSWAGVEVRAKASWQATRRKISPRKGARRGGARGGRGAGRIQPKEQPVVQAANPTAPVTQADLAAMEQYYQDMLQAPLAPFLAMQQTQAAPAQAQTVPPPASVEAQPASVQLSVKAKHLRDFRKYNPKTFDGSMDNPTKAQMWLTSIEKISKYMKCPDDQKVQYAVFFLEDRGTAWWETAERMLGGDYAKQQKFLNLEQGDMTVEQYDANFDMLSCFAFDVVKDEKARTEKFVRGLRLDLQGIVRALRPTTHVDALCLTLDLSLHERVDPSKAADRGSALGQKRKVESQPDVTPQRNLRLGGVFQRHRRELAAAGRTLRDYLFVLAVEEFMEVVAWPRVEFTSSAGNQGMPPTLVLENSLRLPRTGHPLPNREEFLPLLVRRPSELHVGSEVESLSGVLSVSTPSEEDFDVILGMDWLSANHASIDYFRKEVVFNPPFGTSFKFKGAGIVCIPKVISAMKASKLLSQGRGKGKGKGKMTSDQK